MYLSRIPLHPRRSQAQRLVANPQMMHAAVMASSPPESRQPADEGRVLWRLDHDDPRQPLLYALTPSMPSWSHLVEQAGWENSESPYQVRDYAPVLAAISEGREFSFRLAANPTHSVSGSNRTERSKTYAHVTAEQQIGWLLARGAAMGVEFCDGSAGARQIELRERTQLSFRRDAALVTLSRVAFMGRLRVVEPKKLRLALTSGVGRGKAYGCGLLTLAP